MGRSLTEQAGTGAAARHSGPSLPALLAGDNKIAGNSEASLRDIGDGLALFEIHRKMNSFDPAVQDVLEETLARAGRGFRALILANGSDRAFSAGADLNHFLGLIERDDFDGLTRFIRRGQELFQAMKYAPVPVVAAVKGVALGGGCEFALHADAIVADADARFGLPEVKLGVLPAWGGCTQLLLRAQAQPAVSGPLAPASAVFELILHGWVSGSADKAREKGFLRDGDVIVEPGGDVFEAARARAIELADGYTPPDKPLITVTGHSGWLGLMQPTYGMGYAGRLTDTDLRVGGAIADVLTGGPAGEYLWRGGEEDLMRRELEALVSLCRTVETRDRMAHFLKTGEPLRN